MKTLNTQNAQTIEEYEAHLRRMRANIYGYIDDIQWANAREIWMKPENAKWLKEQPENELANP